jgi:adenosylhomocysteine nucleosidase
VVSVNKRYPTDRDWARRLSWDLSRAIHADIASVDAPVVAPPDKRALRNATHGVAVDMESHIAAAAAEAHGLPFAACRGYHRSRAQGAAAGRAGEPPHERNA